MKKLFLIFVLLVAFVIPATASAITINMALLKLANGATCLQSTSPPCQLVSSVPDGDRSLTRVDNAIGLSGHDCSAYGCYWYPGGFGYGMANYNACTCNPSWINVEGNTTVQARQACPVGGGYKRSPGKTMYVNWNYTPWNYFGTLQIIDQGGCQPG